MRGLHCRICGEAIERPFRPWVNRRSPIPIYPVTISARWSLSIPSTSTPVTIVTSPSFRSLSEQRTSFNAGYAYFSSYSSSWLEHCRRYADMAVDRFS